MLRTGCDLAIARLLPQLLPSNLFGLSPAARENSIGWCWFVVFFHKAGFCIDQSHGGQMVTPNEYHGNRIAIKENMQPLTTTAPRSPDCHQRGRFLVADDSEWQGIFGPQARGSATEVRDFSGARNYRVQDVGHCHQQFLRTDDAPGANRSACLPYPPARLPSRTRTRAMLC